jgi:hydroxymethylpyrimidine/phosphomethylpyrimidine kinase
MLGWEVTDEERMESAAQEIFSLGLESVLIKGGHLEGAANDLLFDGKDLTWF